MSLVRAHSKLGFRRVNARRSPIPVGIASVVTALLAWLLQAMVGRTLGPTDYANFMVVWGLIFLQIGILQGLQQEVTRAGASPWTTLSPPRARTSPVALSLVVGAAGTVVLLLTSPLWSGRTTGRDSAWVAVVVSLGFIAYAVFNAVSGGVAARKEWNDYSFLILADGCVRLVLVLVVVASGGGVVWQAFALSATSLAWTLLLPRRNVREAVQAKVPVARRELLSGALHAMIATGCSAIMVAGFPVLLLMTARTGLTAEAGIVIAAVVATRAPILLPLNAAQMVLIARIAATGGALRAGVRFIPIALALIVAGSVAAWALGPALLRAVYGSEFVISGGLVAALFIGAGLIAIHTVVGTAALAVGQHRAMALSWLASAALTTALLSLDMPIGQRSALALAAGPLVGSAIAAVAVVHQAKQRPAGPVAA